MPDTYKPVQIKSLPGIKRDGTMLEGGNYVDGRWVRFQRGLPRKIGGYRSINKYLREMPNAIEAYTRNGLTYLHAGEANHLERLYIDGSLNTSVITDRTPSSGFTADDDNMWSFTIATKLVAGVFVPYLLAQVAPNAACICNDEGGALFAGELFDTGALTQVSLATGATPTGGVVALHPYALVYGDNGYIAWSVAGDPLDFTSAGSGSVNAASQKIVAAKPLRGGGSNSPAGLFWSADALVRATFVGGTSVFAFDTIASEISILGQNCVVEYDGVFYWPGTSNFMQFNGVVREVENNLNVNWFFDNLNGAQRQKVFGFKVPRFGEIWWCFPFGSAEVCTHAIIYNVRENTWYDTELGQGGRSAGVTPTVFPKPLLTGTRPADPQAFDVAVNAGGAGYTAGDTLTVSGGTPIEAVELTVTTVSAGAITGVVISNAGLYGSTPTNPVSVTGGSGSGATFDLTFVEPFKLWVHEAGVDAIDGQDLQPIESYFETGEITMAADNSSNAAISVVAVEPDFVQTGDMTLQIKGRVNARAAEVTGPQMSFPDVASSPQEQVLRFKEERRQLRFKFGSNVLGGDYQMGQPFAQIMPGNERIT